MPKEFEGLLDARKRKVALVVSRFNSFVTERLLEGALDCLRRHGAADGDLHVYRVPGSFELPLLARRLAGDKRYDGVACLGCLIRGATPHFDHIAAEATKGIALAALETGTPVVYGLLTCDTLEQAIERAGSKMGNKGWEAALALIETMSLLERAFPQDKEIGF